MTPRKAWEMAANCYHRPPSNSFFATTDSLWKLKQKSRYPNSTTNSRSMSGPSTFKRRCPSKKWQGVHPFPLSINASTHAPSNHVSLNVLLRVTSQQVQNLKKKRNGHCSVTQIWTAHQVDFVPVLFLKNKRKGINLFLPAVSERQVLFSQYNAWLSSLCGLTQPCL